MPFIAIPRDARDKLVEGAKRLRNARKAGQSWNIEFEEAWRAGFLDAMRSRYPSETVGLLATAYDDELDRNDSA